MKDNLPKKLRPEWNRTQYLEERIEHELDTGTFAGRPIIRKDSPINGGVYLGAHQREAIVIDGDSSRLLESCYQRAKLLASCDTKNTKKVTEDQILNSVYDTVREVMRYDKDKTEKLIAQLDANHDQKISLGVFVKVGYGVCRHMALLAGYLLERFQQEGHLGGKVSVDRNTWFRSGHAWCRYTNSAGQIYIIDPAQGKLGPLEKIAQEKDSWFYKRETD